METDVTHAAAEASRGVEGAPRTVGVAGWRRVVVWVANYELAFILLPVGAALLVNQLPWRWVVGSWVVVPITWLARWIARGRLTVQTPLNIPIAILILMTGVGVYPSVDLSLTLTILAKMLAGIGLFYAMVNTLDSEKALWMLAGSMLVAGMGIAAISVGNTDWTTNKLFAAPDLYRRLPRFFDVLNPRGFSRNIVGGTLGMLLPLSVALLIRPSPQRVFNTNRILSRVVSQRTVLAFAGVAALVIGGIALFTQSRGALAGMAVALFVMVIWLSRWALVLIPVGVGGIALAVQRFGLQTVMDFILVTDVTPSAQGRFELWQRAIYMLQDFPYTGIGLGTFSRVTPVLYPLFLIGPDAEVPHAHNLYLQTGVDLGIPGLVARLGVIAAFLLVSASGVRRARGSTLEGVAVGTMSGFMVYLVHGLVDNVTFSAKPAVVLWALMGLATAVWLYLGKSPACETQSS